MIVKPEIHVGDIGTVFEATIKDGTEIVPVNGAIAMKLLFRKPNLTVIERNAVLVNDGLDGKIKYTTVDANDLDQKGVWKIQGFVQLPSGSWHSDTYNFTVYENLVVTPEA
jgi:hypothetical protein